jgi:hypothetical protein
MNDVSVYFFVRLLFNVYVKTNIVDPNPKESEYFGWIRIRKKVLIQTLL